MSDKKNALVIAYKGFDKNFQCRGYQFKVGESYAHKGAISLCMSGFHVCEFPLDIWNYYPPVDGNQAAQVELGGATEEKQNDSKRVGNSLKVKASLNIEALVSASVEWIFNEAKKTDTVKGTGKTVASSGYSSTAASSGDYSKAVCDTNGFACVAGIKGFVKGNAGSAFSCGYKDSQERNRIAVAYVGENGIKADTWYVLDDKGKFQEAK